MGVRVTVGVSVGVGVRIQISFIQRHFQIFGVSVATKQKNIILFTGYIKDKMEDLYGTSWNCNG